MYVCTQTHDDSMRYTCQTAGALRRDIAHSFDCLPLFFTMPEDAIEPSISLPKTFQCGIVADTPSLKALNCATSASNSTTTRTQPDNDDKHRPEPYQISSRPSHPNLDHISRSPCAGIYFPSIPYV